MALIALIAGAVLPPAAVAQVVGGLCIQEETGLNNPSCTANDVRISQLDVIGGPPTCMPGEILNLTVRATIESGPARYDIGIWLNETGGSARTDPGGTCYRNFLTPISPFPGCNQDGGPYLDADSDACGDVPAVGVDCSVVTVPCGDGGGTCTVSRRTFDITLTCHDSDADGRADVGSCTSWDNNTGTICNGVEDVVPGTGAKCNCGSVPIGDIFIDPCAGVDCSGSNTACGVASCDSEGEPGNCDVLTPVAGGTLCRGAVAECDAPEFCDGASTDCPTDGYLPPGTACGDGTSTVCDGADSCDGAGGCQDNPSPPSTVCRADAGDCDVAEYCDGAGNCPGDGYDPPGTACGDPSDSVCDDPDTCDASGNCTDNPAPPATLCREDSGDCDVPEYCDGAGSCPADGFDPAGTACGDPTDTVCDNPDTCDASGRCTDNNSPTSTECRPDAGECDVPEYCDGDGNCPANGSVPDGTACGDTDSDECTTAACEGGSCVQDHDVTSCADPTCDLCDPGTGACVPRDPLPAVCEVTAICRTPGFWGSRGGNEKGNRNITQAVIDASPGGFLDVCGQVIDSTIPVGDLSSALEAECVKVEGVWQRMLYRQLTAAALNCVVSGAEDCDALIPGYDACNAACLLGADAPLRTVGECVNLLDCFNNGGLLDAENVCSLGTCSIDNAACGSRAGACAFVDPTGDGTNDNRCVKYPRNCHDRDLCEGPNPDLCFVPLGGASSANACKEANGNDCTIDSCP